MQIKAAGTTPDAPATTVALYYPTIATPRAIAIGGKPADKVKALILLSHGIGGCELGHIVLAQALARNAAASFAGHRRDAGRSSVEGSAC